MSIPEKKKKKNQMINFNSVQDARMDSSSVAAGAASDAGGRYL